MSAKILGRLRGIIASAKEKSRNGRLYTESFWDSKFNSELFQEGMKNKVFLGQCYHPDDDEEYTQIHMDDRSAIVLTDVKKDNKDYIGTFEILPTKAGQCVRNLLDVGVIFGVSSRGLADFDADVFDENIAQTYDLITWDLVAFPGVKCCRLHEVGAVAEGLKVKQVNKVKIMENLRKLTLDDHELASYVNQAIKAKEDFNNQLQVDDMMAHLNIPNDYLAFANYVYVKDGVPVYNDGEHGEHPVMYTDKSATFDDNNVYLIDGAVYDERMGKYVVRGEWLKVN